MLCFAESQRRKREEMLETSNTLLRQKLDKARASAHMPQEDDANSSLGVQTSTPRSGWGLPLRKCAAAVTCFPTRYAHRGREHVCTLSTPRM